MRIIGAKAERGNIVNVLLPAGVNKESQDKLKQLIEKLLKELGESGASVTVGAGTKRRIDLELSRELRGRTAYICEAIGVVTFLFVNRELYKSEVHDKRGRVIRLPFSDKNSVNPLVKVIAEAKRSTADTYSSLMGDDDRVDLPRILDLCKNDFLPRLVEAINHGNSTIRVGRGIRHALEKASNIAPTNSSQCDKCGHSSYPPVSANIRLCDYHLIDFVLGRTREL